VGTATETVKILKHSYFVHKLCASYR